MNLKMKIQYQNYYQNEDMNANLFTDKLIQTHAKQIIALDSDLIKSLKLKQSTVNHN